jgi:hypothetical protein
VCDRRLWPFDGLRDHRATLAEHGFVDKHRAGNNNYFINTRLVRLLMAVSEED